MAWTAVLLLLGMVTPLYASSAWSNTADPPATRAAAILKQMNLSEKVVMLHGQRGVSHVGHDSNYTGLILGNKRLGIPAIQMEDGPQGFRCGKNRHRLSAAVCSRLVDGLAIGPNDCCNLGYCTRTTVGRSNGRRISWEGRECSTGAWYVYH
jgi:beta-glucosidase